jgi:ferrous iron transport protein B
VVAGQSAPGGDPRVFQVDGSEIAVRRETARRLKIHRQGTPFEEGMSECATAPAAARQRLPHFPAHAVKAVAVIGPPNSGKTTLFNRLTGLRQKVANFPGVTVEQHTGIAELSGGRTVELIDLPGVYSLSPHSEDEQVAYDVLTGRARRHAQARSHPAGARFDQSGRHLMLAAPILALGLPTLMILNMADDLRSRGGTRGHSKSWRRSWARRWRW